MDVFSYPFDPVRKGAGWDEGSCAGLVASVLRVADVELLLLLPVLMRLTETTQAGFGILVAPTRTHSYVLTVETRVGRCCCVHVCFICQYIMSNSVSAHLKIIRVWVWTFSSL